MARVFPVAVVLNLVLLVAYEVANSFVLLDFFRRSVSSNVAGFNWSPIMHAIGFGTTSVAPDGTLIAGDGVTLIPNLHFLALVGLVCANLYIIWKLEKNKRTPNKA